jgi:hypothetical protein
MQLRRLKACARTKSDRTEKCVRVWLAKTPIWSLGPCKVLLDPQIRFA